MLWLALHLPQLALEAFCATLPVAAEGEPPPVALLDDHRVHSVNAAAAARGVRPGLKKATALALAGQLQLADRHPQREADALLAVAHAALAFTPAVTLHDEQTVLLEVQASLRLFGGLPRLRRRLAAALAPLGHRLQIAAAPTAWGAVVLAQWHPQGGAQRGLDLVEGGHATQLRTLQLLLCDAPVWLLGPGRAHWEALQGMGLKTLGCLRQLPRSGVARRFGADLLDELGMAFGEQPDPRLPLELPPVFDSRLELFARAETTAQVLHGAAVLLARLVAWAQGRQARVCRFTLRMLHERRRQVLRPPTELPIELAEPGLDIAHLQLLLRERLGRVELMEPTLELQLHCSHTVAAPPPNGELFPTRAGAEQNLLRLVERLRARLGDEQVQRLVPVADHRPERASLAVPWTAPQPDNAQASAPLADPEFPLARPAWLLAEPLPLSERDRLPLLQGRPLALMSGPERIESGWWDGGLVERDYYIAAQEDGALVWIFHGRRGHLPGQANWYLQGRFA